MMNKKFTVLLSLLLAATLTIPAFAGTTTMASKANKKLDTVGQYTVVVDDKDTGVEVPVMVPLRKMAKATGMKVPYEICPRRPGDIDTCYSSAALAEKELGWKAENGIKEMCEDSWRWQKMNPNGYDD